MKLVPPLSMWRHFRYCTHLGYASTGGVELGVVDQFGGDTLEQLRRVSPSHPVHCPSNRILPLLLDEARKYEHGETASINFGHRVRDFVEYKDGVEASVSVEAGGYSNDSSYKVRCKYLIGCDGASSVVRAGMEMPLKGKSGK